MSNPFIVMIKSLLLTSALMLGVFSAYAFVEPKTYENVTFQGISPNGNIIASECNGNYNIFDLANGKEYSYNTTGEDPYYTSGLGNIVSNNGIVLASTRSICDAAYWENGEWKQLDAEGAVSNSFANGITPDGARICGSLGIAESSIEESNMMLVPVYWDRNADGTYGKYTILPHPDRDLFGSVPQSVTANYISDDGKTIAGQVVDGTGFINMPIVYRQDNEGKWSYKLLLEDSFIPEGMVLPEDPGEAPACPLETDYMTPEEIAAYDEAYQAYIDSNYSNPYPEYKDFMTDEEIAAYEAAYAEYQPLFEEWSKKSDAYYEAFEAIINAAPMFETNFVFLTPDGKTYLSSVKSADDSNPWAPSFFTPWAINIEDGSVSKFETGGKSMMISSVPNSKYCFATSGINTVPIVSYILSLADGSVTSVENYLSSLSPELAEWIDINLRHEVEIPNWETEESTFESLLYTGIARASADMSTLAIWDDGSWGSWICGGVIFDLSQYSGISAPSVTDNANIWIDNDGNLIVDGDVTNVDVYDLNGRRVLSTNKSGSTPCLLAKGIYIVKATTADGNSFTAKIVR